MSQPRPFASSAIAERRQFGRRAMCKPAIIIGGNCERYPCTIVDISESGVGLRTKHIEEVAERFYLLDEAEDTIILCQLVHKTNGILGAKFLRAPRVASQFNTQSALRVHDAMQRAFAKDTTRNRK